ncbi:alpha-ketoglutarate-dependent dioxygenase AlkB [Paracoccus sp. MC1854]|uniref:alpha-ketoglutarate-dependent dioxygenase AlkB family protein n=1 Tax=Paracoccus sp. MC1854 TaxID=2760306 RepID=UPI0015FF17E9|nr:alpha-ketoglutarate-dependent dioxygenase AlkB [Paracoccus sp. MC1854]MBB1490212.1 alpha-ketoglutarate-dependent dioxygenase AlkB [Paracoccus sp. MC1854]
MTIAESSPNAAESAAPLVVRGFAIHRGFLDAPAQAALMAAVGRIWTEAPPLRPVTRWGKPLSVAMTSAGALGWTTDRRGYRYEPAQPDGRPWPPIPPMLLDLWQRVTGVPVLPDSCLVNLYRDGARMGLHQDRDEAELHWPVLSVSLGDEALFRIGNLERGGTTESVWLSSGDVVVMAGAARLTHHGIDRIRPGSSALVPGGGRVNLTLRVAAPTA